MANPSELETSQSNESIQYLSTLLESQDINDQSTAILTLSQLSHDANISQDMLKSEIHLILLRLLSPFEKESNNHQSYASKPQPKILPHLINEVLQTLIHLIPSDDFFESVPTDSFQTIINILNHESYTEICQQNVYALIATACECNRDVSKSVIDDILITVPKDKDALAAVLGLCVELTATSQSVESAIEFLDKLMKSNLWNEISIIINNALQICDLATIYCFEIVWHICQHNDAITDWKQIYNARFCNFITTCLAKKQIETMDDCMARLTKQISDDMKDKSTADEEDIEKWRKQQNKWMDTIHTISIALDLYLELFEYTDEQRYEDQDEDEQRRQYECILPKDSINNVVGLIINHWMNKECYVDLDVELNVLWNTLKSKQMNVMGRVISETMVSISSSQWQSLWDRLLDIIAEDNEHKENEEMDEEMVTILRIGIVENYKELNITKQNVNALLRLHSRVRNVQDMWTQFNIKNLNSNEENDYIAMDLAFVNDINGYQLDINGVLVNLFKMEIVRTNEDHQRSILNVLFDDVDVLSQNIEFVDVLLTYCDENKDVYENAMLNEMFEERGRPFQDAMHVGFETCQLILDIMCMDDKYVKLSMNKKRFEHILQLYKVIQTKWSRFKTMIGTLNANAKNETLIEWTHIDTITHPVEECIINIDKFIECK